MVLLKIVFYDIATGSSEVEPIKFASIIMVIHNFHPKHVHFLVYPVGNFYQTKPAQDVVANTYEMPASLPAIDMRDKKEFHLVN